MFFGQPVLTPACEYSATVAGGMAQIEAEWGQENQRESAAASRSRLERFGRPRRQIPSSEARRLRNLGFSSRFIAAKLGVPLKTLHRALNNLNQPRKRWCTRPQAQNGKSAA